MNVTDATYTITDLVSSYYIVGVVAVYGDMESSVETVDFTYEKAVGINNANAFDFNIYPNPANNWVTISGAQNSSIQVISVTGNVVLMSDNTEKLAKVNISELSSGVYFIKVTNDEGSAVKRLTVE